MNNLIGRPRNVFTALSDGKFIASTIIVKIFCDCEYVELGGFPQSFASQDKLRENLDDVKLKLDEKFAKLKLCQRVEAINCDFHCTAINQTVVRAIS